MELQSKPSGIVREAITCLGGYTMSELVVIGFANEYMAEEVRQALFRMQRADLVDLEDAVVAVKAKDGQIKLHQASNPTTAGAVRGGFWGTLIGALFLSPLLGA